MKSSAQTSREGRGDVAAGTVNRALPLDLTLEEQGPGWGWESITVCSEQRHIRPVTSGENGDTRYHCVDCHTSCSVKIISCYPHNNPTLGKITTSISQMRPLKHREVNQVAQGHTASNWRKRMPHYLGMECFLIESLKAFVSLSRDQLGHGLLRAGPTLR